MAGTKTNQLLLDIGLSEFVADLIFSSLQGVVSLVSVLHGRM